MNALLERLRIEHPIICAPMGGGPSTPELVAGVSNAGGMGSLACAYLSPEQTVAEIRRTRELTDRPFAVNLFAGGYEERDIGDSRPMLALLGEVHAILGIDPPVVPAPTRDPFPQQFDVVVAEKPRAFSFTFGVPRKQDLDRARAAGMLLMGTATTLHEAKLLADAGVDAIIAQGAEAGAHRGTFAGPFEHSMVPTLELVRQIVAAVRLPVVASGGLMDGPDIRKALDAGASAVQLGTAFLACPESGASQAYKKALLEAKEDTTVITRAFSGRPARGLENEFIRRVGERNVLPFPVQNPLTRAMRAAAAKKGDPRFLSLWAGQGVARTRAIPAGELVRVLVQEMEEPGRTTSRQ